VYNVARKQSSLHNAGNRLARGNLNVIELLSQIAKQERTPDEYAALVAELAQKLPTSLVKEEVKNVLAQKGE